MLLASEIDDLYLSIMEVSMTFTTNCFEEGSLIQGHHSTDLYLRGFSWELGLYVLYITQLQPKSKLDEGKALRVWKMHGLGWT